MRDHTTQIKLVYIVFIRKRSVLMSNVALVLFESVAISFDHRVQFVSMENLREMFNDIPGMTVSQVQNFSNFISCTLWGCTARHYFHRLVCLTLETLEDRPFRIMYISV